MNKNKRKGFTLIELLAVFVVLAIIASIVIIIVGGLINDSKDKATVVSAKNYANAINNHILSSKLKDFNIPDGTYRIMPNGNVCIGAYADGECDGDILEIDLQKGNPIGGQVVINNRKVSSVINASFNGKTISYDFIKDKRLKNTTPELYDFAVTRYSNSIKLNFIALNAVKYTCEYGLQEDLGNKGIINSAKTECMINNLKPGMTYHYKIEITSSAGEKVNREGTVSTLSIIKPQMSVSPAGFSLSKTVTVNFTRGELIEPEFYLYTTSQATTTSSVTTCGDDFEPGECDNTPTNELLADHWYKLNSLTTAINVVYNINTTLIAKVTDGRVTVATSQIVITNIDNEGPNVKVDDVNYGENAYIHLHDDQSGVRYFAVTTSTDYPSLTSDTETTTGSSINTWYPVPVTTEEIVTTFTNLDAGEYYAWGKDNLGNTSYEKFEVKKLKDSFTIEPKVAVYTGSPIPANDVVKHGTGEVTYKYYESNNCTGNDIGVPVNVGKYSVRVVLGDTTNYIGGSKCISHEITKATPIITMSATEGIVAVGAQISFTISSNVSGTFTLTNQNNSIATVSTSSITANANQTYTVTLTGVHIGKDTVSIKFVPTDTRNYKNVENLKYTATVLESIPVPTTASTCKDNVIYNTEKQTIIKSYVTGLVYLNEIQTNAGNYEVTIMIDPASSLLWSDKTSTPKKVTCTIKKAEDPITVTHKTVTYNKNKQEPTFSSPSGLTITKTYYSDSSCTTAKEPKDAGVYYAKASTPGNSNYNPGAMACTKAITINKVKLTPSATCSDKTYDTTTAATCTISLATVLSGESVGTTKSCAFANATAAQNKTVTCSSIALTGDYAKNYELTTTTATDTATINKQKVNKPRNVAISTAGNVTWDAPSPNNATGYQISIDGSNFTSASSGIDYLSTITASTGSRTVYVRAINSDTTNYDTPSDNATQSTTVYTLTVSSNDTTYGTVNVSSYKVISGATYSTSSNVLTVSGKNGSGTSATLKTVTATAKTLDGYKPALSSWSSTSGTFNADKSITANFSANPNKLTVNIYANGATTNSSGQTVTEKLTTEELYYGGTVTTSWPTDYADPYGYKLVRTGYKKDGYYHIGSGTATSKITQDLGETTVVGVADKLGVLSNLKSGNVTVNLYAGWTPNKLTVTFYANGATKDSSGQTVNEKLGTEELYYGGTVTTSWPTDYADPYGYKLVRTGYKKDGYYHIGSGTSSSKVTQDLGVTTVAAAADKLGVLSTLESGNATVDLYAGWTPNVLTVKLHPNGATKNNSGSAISDPMETLTYNYDGTVGYQWPSDYRPPYGYKLVRDGYSGTGVYHVGSASSSTTIVQDYVTSSSGMAVTTLASNLGFLTNLQSGNYTLDLYAGWSLDTYSITYNLDGGTNGSGNPSNYTVETSTITLAAPSKTGYSFTGWTGSNGTTAQTSVTIPKGTTGNKTYTANWKSAPTPSVTCSVSGSDVTGTGSRYSGQTGRLVGEKVTCTCNGNGANPTSLVLKSGNTQVASASGNGTGTISASYKIESPSQVNITAECNNGSSATTSTGTINYYRRFKLAFDKNGATSISSSGGTQYLMANSTNDSYDKGTTFSSTMTRTTNCGMSNGCGVVGWGELSSSTSKYLDNGKTINLCWSGTSGCSTSTSSSTATLAVSGDKTLYAVTYGTIVSPPAAYGSDLSVLSSTWMSTNLTTSTIDNSSRVILESTSGKAYVYNTRRDAVAFTQTLCAWVWGSGTNNGYDTYKNNNANLMYYDAVNDTSTTIGTGLNPGSQGSVFLAIPLGDYKNNGTDWWCAGRGAGFTITLNPNYSGPGTTNVTVHYGSREGNKVSLPSSRSGYTFEGYYTSGSGGSKVYDSNGKNTSNGNIWSKAWPNGFYDLISNTTLYAHWSPITYSITYTTNGGSGNSNNPSSYTIETSTFTLKNLTKPGYSFLGWSGTGLSGNSNKTVTIPKGSTGNRSYNANFSKITYSITFTYNYPCGSNGCSGPSSTTLSKTITDTAPTPTYSGKTFKGWYSKSSNGHIVFNSNGTANTSADEWTGSSTSLTLYAQWQ